MEKQTAVSPGSETILSLFFPYSFLSKWRTYCIAEGTRKSTAVYSITLWHLGFFAADWLAGFQQNDFFIITNEHVWTCWHLAVTMKWCKLGLKVKNEQERFFNYSLEENPCFTFILCTIKAHYVGCSLASFYEGACHPEGSQAPTAWGLRVRLLSSIADLYLASDSQGKLTAQQHE